MEKKARKTKTGASLEKASYDELVRLKRDNFERENFVLTASPRLVSIWEQPSGGPPKQEGVVIPRSTFNWLIRQYQREQRFVRKPI